MFSDADYVTGDDDSNGVAPSCAITSGYYHENYVLTVAGCILVTSFGLWFFQVCLSEDTEISIVNINILGASL